MKARVIVLRIALLSKKEREIILKSSFILHREITLCQEKYFVNSLLKNIFSPYIIEFANKLNIISPFPA
jgi:hypothetical protein